MPSAALRESLGRLFASPRRRRVLRRSDRNRLGAESLEARRLMAIDIPGYVPVSQGTFTGELAKQYPNAYCVPVDDSDISGMVLEKDVHYKLVAEGQMLIRPGSWGGPINWDYHADAEYTRLEDVERFGTLPKDNTQDVHFVDVGIRINYEEYPDWGPYSRQHVYVRDVIGTGSAFTFGFNDSYHADNVNDGNLRLTVYREMAVDLDVDSDNNDGLKTPNRDDEEERNEPKTPKKLVVNDNDTDGDRAPDYADWSIPGKRFTPLVIEIPTGPPLASMQLTVSYAASDPALIGPDRRLPDDSATNPLRIWTKNAGELRNTASVTAGGTFVPAGRIIEDLNTLGFNDDKRIVELYVEGIHTTAGVPQPISIQLTVGGRATTPDLVNVVVVSNTLVIGIDGTDSAEWLAKRDAKGNLFNERTMPDGSTRWNSHVRNLVADCEPFAMTYYTAGPDQRGLFDDSDAVFRRARDAARALIQDAGGGTTIALVGWSRGAMIASGVAHALLTLADGELPRTVAFIGMYDPVDMSNGIPPAWATLHAGVQAVTIIGPTADRQTEDAFNVDYPVADGGFNNPPFERMALENRITTAQGAAAVPQRKFYNASHGAIGGTPGYNKRHRDGGAFPENYDYTLDVRDSIRADKDVRAGMRAAGLPFVPDRDAAWYGFPDDRPPKEHRA